MDQEHRAHARAAQPGGDVQRRLAVGGREVRGGLARNQELAHNGARVLHGPAGGEVQGPVSSGVPLVVRREAALDEHVHARRILAEGGLVQCQAAARVAHVRDQVQRLVDVMLSVAILVHLRGVRAAVHDDSGAVRVPLRARKVQRGPITLAAPGFQMRVGLHQELQAVRVTARRRKAGGRSVEERTARRVRRGPLVEQQSHDLREAPAGRGVQRR
mmetsp:Transcript_11176/g.33031  ORF Transcript_11176/g.33031 Transcript_11176/m.33031 type:complete len:216 (-) Transcript_11176:251-898(-)